jgi:hypothetical protein
VAARVDATAASVEENNAKMDNPYMKYYYFLGVMAALALGTVDNAIPLYLGGSKALFSKLGTFPCGDRLAICI